MPHIHSQLCANGVYNILLEPHIEPYFTIFQIFNLNLFPSFVTQGITILCPPNNLIITSCLTSNYLKFPISVDWSKIDSENGYWIQVKLSKRRFSPFWTPLFFQLVWFQNHTRYPKKNLSPTGAQSHSFGWILQKKLLHPWYGAPWPPWPPAAPWPEMVPRICLHSERLQCLPSLVLLLHCPTVLFVNDKWSDPKTFPATASTQSFFSLPHRSYYFVPTGAEAPNTNTSRNTNKNTNTNTNTNAITW